MLIHQTITGKINQSPIIGHTIKSVVGKKIERQIEARPARKGDTHIIRKDSMSSNLLWNSSFVAEFHSRSRLFEIINLQHVRNKAFRL